MQSLGLCLCILAIFHGQLIDAFPNEGQPSESYIASTDITASWMNHSTWDNLGKVMIRLSDRNNTFQIHLSGSVEKGSTQHINEIVDIKDVENLQPPINKAFSVKLGKRTYNLEFADTNEARKYFEAIKTAKKEYDALINPSTQGPDPTVGPQNANTAGESSMSRKIEHDEAHHNNSAVSSTQQRHYCTISTQHYDCQIQGVHITESDLSEFRYEPQKRTVTFRDSVIRFLPKSLIDAFPNMELLNLNQVKMVTIQNHAFDNATKLKSLFLEGNRLQTFPVKVLNGARDLEKLVLTNNDILSMPYSFRGNNLLKYLFVNRNKINKLPIFEYIPQLEIFDGSNNVLEHIEWNQFIQQYKLENINLSHNQLTNLNLQLSSEKLQTVDISNNKLAHLNITLLMEHLNIENNVLSTFDIPRRCSLKSLKMSNNSLRSQPDFTNCDSMEILNASNNLLETFRYSDKFQNLQILNLAGNNLFEFFITIKPKTQQKLVLLDLSHNKLSHLSSLASFVHLKELRLNNNQLLGIQHNHVPKRVTSLFVSNNQWKCDDVTIFTKVAKDAVTNCNNGFHLVQGTCCKNYRKTFNDVLNEMVKSSYFHEQSNYNTLKIQCPQKQYSTRNDDIEQIRRLASQTDLQRSQMYESIANTKEKVTQTQKDLNAIKNDQITSRNFIRSMQILIENKRNTYHVVKEGLITDKEMLNRVIQFVHQRDAFVKDMLKRRQNETNNTNASIDQKAEEIDRIKTENANLKKNIAQIKLDEKSNKQQIQKLQRKVNGNSPSVYGVTGGS